MGIPPNVWVLTDDYLSDGDRRGRELAREHLAKIQDCINEALNVPPKKEKPDELET